MAGDTSFSFTLKDRWGAEHHYTSHYLPCGIGFDLAAEVLEIGAPMLRVVGLLDDEGKDADGGISTSEQTMGGLGEAIATFAGAIARHGGHRKIVEIMQNTVRDDTKLDKTAAHNQCYQGNLLELVKALTIVLKGNYADFFEAGSAFAGRAGVSLDFATQITSLTKPSAASKGSTATAR